jgi:hypothetical protein
MDDATVEDKIEMLEHQVKVIKCSESSVLTQYVPH